MNLPGEMKRSVCPYDCPDTCGDLKDGERVIAFNLLGEVSFLLQVTPRVPSGVVVAEGVWWLDHCLGSRGVNALTSQRLTDRGAGSTFYDNTVDVRKEP